MGCPTNATLGTNLTFSITTKSSITGIATDCDTDPNYSIYEDVTTTPILTGTMSKLNDPVTTGFYAATVAATTANGFERNKTYTVFITAIVGGVSSNKDYAFTVQELAAIPPMVVTGPAMTRDQIIAQVRSNTGVLTGRDEAINTMCNEAIKYACIKHSFNDACTELDVSVASGEEYCALPTGKFAITSIRMYRGSAITAATPAWPLKIKDRAWWDRNIINPRSEAPDNPTYGLMFAGNLYFWPIANADYIVRFRMVSVPVFSSGAQTCPISVLDIFVMRYATAFLFKALEDDTSFSSWYLLSKESLDDAIVADTRKPAQSLDLGQQSNGGADPQRPDLSGGLHTSGDLGDISWI